MIPGRADLPAEVKALAMRCGASLKAPPSAVVLNQIGFMKDDPDHSPTPFAARETIQIGATEFLWEARCDPINMLVVRDQLVGSQGKLSLLAFGAFPLSTVTSGARATRGEVIRYLAELPWAPDAILHNDALAWEVVNPRVLVVSAGEGPARGSVTFRLNDQGFVQGVAAHDRPRREGRHVVERPWRGRFAAYQEHHGRMVPGRGEMGWVVDGEVIDSWFGELRDWSIH